jgi:riboflavin kinase/FMN adenylyltransferase
MLVIDWEHYIDCHRPIVPEPPFPERQENKPHVWQGDKPLAMSIGVFDGVHRGHQRLIEKIRFHAGEHGGLGVVLTFTRNPRHILRPRCHGGDIYSLPQKLDTLEKLGVELTVLIDFSGNFSKISGKEFTTLIGRRQVRYLAVGVNFRCGYHQDTDAQTIQELVAANGTCTELVSQVRDTGEPVSSSRIRGAIQAGDLAGAAALLGRPLSVDLAGLQPRLRAGACCWDLREAGRVLPPNGRYDAVVYAANSNEGQRTVITIDSGCLFNLHDPSNGNVVSVEFT